MPSQDSRRRCGRCEAVLARDNTDRWCSSCRAKQSDDLVRPPVVGRDFWLVEPMRSALESWHMGKVIRAYREHPQHRRVIPQETIAGWLNLTQAQLSRIEHGKPPEELGKLIRWANILGVPGSLLWFKLPQDRTAAQQPRDARRVSTARGTVADRGASGSASLHGHSQRDEPVERRSFIGIGAGLAGAKLSPAINILAALHPAAAPSTVSERDIEQVRSAAALFTTWDHTYGGGIVREAVIAQLRWAASLLDADCPARLRNVLFVAVGYLSSVCGFMAFDAYAHDEGKRMFEFGLACAEEADEWQLRGKILSNMARQAIWRGDPDQGLTYTELALVRSDRLTASELAMLHTARARALGKLGRAEETLRAVGAADEAFSHVERNADPPWMAYYDHAQHHGDTGHALFDLAMKGHTTVPAADRLEVAVHEHADSYARSRAISGTKLATLTMVTGDPMQAVAIGNKALDDAGQLRSRRAASDLIELRQAAVRHARIPEVAALQERVASLVGHK